MQVVTQQSSNVITASAIVYAYMKEYTGHHYNVTVFDINKELAVHGCSSHLNGGGGMLWRPLAQPVDVQLDVKVTNRCC